MPVFRQGSVLAERIGDLTGASTPFGGVTVEPGALSKNRGLPPARNMTERADDRSLTRWTARDYSLSTSRWEYTDQGDQRRAPGRRGAAGEARPYSIDTLWSQPLPALRPTKSTQETESQKKKTRGASVLRDVR